MKLLKKESRLGTKRWRPWSQGVGGDARSFCSKCALGEEGNDSYHICSLILLPSSSMVLILKSIPERKEKEKKGTSLSAHFPSCIAVGTPT